MNPSQTKAYEAESSKVRSLRAQIEKAAEALIHAGELLKNRPTRVMFANTPGILFPDIAALSWAPTINAAEIPDGLRLAGMVSDLHTAIESAQHAHQALPEWLRKTVASPPSA